MFKGLMVLAGVLRALDEFVVQYGYWRDSRRQDPKRTYKKTRCSRDVIFSDEEQTDWDNEKLSIEDLVATFRRGLQRKHFHERVSSTG